MRKTKKILKYWMNKNRIESWIIIRRNKLMKLKIIKTKNIEMN